MSPPVAVFRCQIDNTEPDFPHRPESLLLGALPAYQLARSYRVRGGSGGGRPETCVFHTQEPCQCGLKSIKILAT